MAVGRFLAMVGALIWRHTDGKYLLLQRSAARDVAAGQWECVTGRLEQGERFLQEVACHGNGLSAEESGLIPGEESADGLVGALRRTEGLNRGRIPAAGRLPRLFN
jgi:8-oxo-dGTP pyrophosphatase MutT (NUDIX family)